MHYKLQITNYVKKSSPLLLVALMLLMMKKPNITGSTVARECLLIKQALLLSDNLSPFELFQIVESDLTGSKYIGFFFLFNGERLQSG